MINETNLKDILCILGFQKNDELYEKKFLYFTETMGIDFAAKKILYPSSIKGRDRNNGFDATENFVVFECVNRLLEKGYRPEHIELEKEWHLGHDAKGGRADICVTDAEGNMLFIIECKTWGKEFNKALNDTKNDGAQLFSYWQQEQSCKWLVLYASDFKGRNIEYKSLTIDCSDDANITLLAKKDKSIKLYCDTHTALEKYAVWKETYACYIHDDLIFQRIRLRIKLELNRCEKKISVILRPMIKSLIGLRKFFAITMSAIKKTHLTV